MVGSVIELYTYNPTKNRLVNVGGTPLTYDDEGQLESMGGVRYTFDYEHRLTSVGTSSYAHDGMGSRRRAVHSGIETRYIYDQDGNLLAEADANNEIINYYLHGLGLLAMVTPEDKTFSYHYDGTGNTIAITDQARNIQNTYAYTPFGITTENETFDQPFTFVGQYGVMHEPNNLYYMRARYYDPVIGRFISEDPIHFAGGDVNLFAYVGNNPINFVDPWGLSSEGEDGYYVGTGIGREALDWYAQRWNETGNWAYAVPGGFAALWTPETYRQTSWTLLGAYGAPRVATSAFQRGGWLNNNRYLRIGWGRHGGERVFRIAGDIIKRVRKSGHIGLWRGGPL